VNDDWTGRRTAPRVASAGEAVVDLIPEMDGDQIVLRVSAGGSPFNVAIGLARLGLDASYAGRLSTDVFGRLLELRLADEGVDVSLIMRGVERTALAIVGRAGDEAIYDFRWSDTADRSYDPARLPMEAFEGLDALHLGSAALGIDPVGARLLTLMEHLHGRVFLSFDPNIRRDVVDDWHEYLSRLRRAFELADLVKISTVDLAAIGEEDGRGESGILGRNLPTILTAGAGGSSLHRADHPVIRVPAARTVVRDTVGAGDALMAGLIYALTRHGALERVRIEALSDVDWRAVLTIANTAGAMTCERVGADPPTAEALQERLGTFA
jgi:fructokinase